MSLDEISSSRSLSLVNDQKIRREMFSTSASLIKKIRQLEKDHADFVRWDQLLYQDWYNLTFRDDLLAVEQLERRYKTLSTFQIHLNHVAKTANVALERAYSMLKEEEIQYQSGDEGWKFVIEKLRQQRFQHATKAKEAPASPAEEVKLNFADIFGDDSALSGVKRQARSVYHYLNEIDDVMMIRHIASSAMGFRLFKQSFEVAMKAGNWRLLGRLWKTIGPEYQKKLLKPMPAHFREFLQRMILETVEESDSGGRRYEVDVKLRSSYRQLAKVLHPDVYGKEISPEFQEWAGRKWQEVQRAYKLRDHEALKRLELLCMAELGLLNNLTLDEIYQCSLFFAEELEALKKKLRSVRKHPAWRFSSRRRYDALTVRIRRELQRRYDPLVVQVSALEEFFRRLAETENREDLGKTQRLQF